jgi:hypothetical protein
MRLAAWLPTLLLLGVAPATALAGNFPTRQGESGLLDVPDAQIMERRTGMVGLEVGFDHAPGTRDRFGPMPLSLGVGLGRLEWGVSVRESGQPGDPHPSPMLFGSALKLGLLSPAGLRPGVAVDGYLDRFNLGGAGGGRLILSTGPLGPLRLAGFTGYEKQPSGASGATGGLAAVVRHRSGVELVLAGLGGPRGSMASAAIRYDLNRRLGVGLVGSYLPATKEYRIALAFGFHAVPLGRTPVPAPPAVVALDPEPEPPPARLLEDRPRFRLRIDLRAPERLGQARHLQYGPSVPAPSGTPRSRAPSADDVLAAQLRDQELELEARQRRLRVTDDGLTTDEANLDADARRLADRERVLAARESQLDARERRLPARGETRDPQRQLATQEAQLASSERQLVALERSFTPARDAAQGAERQAETREHQELAEAGRLLAQSGLEKSQMRQADLRRQALAARQRMLTAMEARLVAREARLDAASRQLRARSDRADTWQRRLDLRSGRLDLFEAQARGPRPALTPGQPHLPIPGAKAGFVMVVRSPTAILRTGPGRPAAGDAGRQAPHVPGIPVERAVAAATVVTFAGARDRISELDRETIDGLAQLAARESCEVLVWARAKDANLMREATRRADEVKALIVSLGNLPPQQVVTRTTTRPGAQGVDVVISALREGGRAPGDVGAPVAPGGRLMVGETAKRQVRDAVVAAQASIERCASDLMVRRGLTHADGTLKLTVAPSGRVTGALAGQGELGGGEFEACLQPAAASWQFPPTDGEYVVEVPITVVGAGAMP